MRHCDSCHVEVRGGQDRCPLCKNTLADSTGVPETPLFPDIDTGMDKKSVFKILIFITVAVVAVSLAVRSIFPTRTDWPLYVIFGLVSLWVIILLILRKGYHIHKRIAWTVVVVSLLSLFWDWRTGFRGWSLDYVIPITCMAALLAMYISAKILKLSINDYITYLLLVCIFGIVLLVFLMLGLLEQRIPTIICICACTVFLAAILIFQGDEIKEELGKRMHI